MGDWRGWAGYGLETAFVLALIAFSWWRTARSWTDRAFFERVAAGPWGRFPLAAATRRALARAQLPLSLAWTFAASMILAPLLSAIAGSTGWPWVLAVLQVDAGFALVAVALTVSVAVLNRPRGLVPPHARHEPGRFGRYRAANR